MRTPTPVTVPSRTSGRAWVPRSRCSPQPRIRRWPHSLRGTVISTSWRRACPPCSHRRCSSSTAQTAGCSARTRCCPTPPVRAHARRSARRVGPDRSSERDGRGRRPLHRMDPRDTSALAGTPTRRGSERPRAHERNDRHAHRPESHRVVARAAPRRRRDRRRQGRQPRRARRRRAPGPRRLRRDCGRVPRRDGTRRGARATRGTRRPRTTVESRRSPRRAAELQGLVRGAGMPEELRTRSSRRTTASATTCSSRCVRRRPARTRPARSFAGMNETFTDVRGEDDARERRRRLLGIAVRRARAVRTARSRGVDRRAGDRGGGAADGRRRASGVMFTADPGDRRPVAHRDRGRVRARARSWSAARSSPTRTSSPRTAPRRSRSHVGAADVRDRAWCRRVATPRRVCDRGGRRARGARPTPRSSSWPRSAMRVEEHYGAPQDMEWAIEDGGRLPRAVATDHDARGAGASAAAPSAAERRRRGPRQRARRVARAWSAARVRVLRTPDEGASLRRRRDPGRADDQPRLGARACAAPAALVTDGGGITCHAAIVSRELGVPCIVGARRRDRGAARRRRRHGRRRPGRRASPVTDAAPGAATAVGSRCGRTTGRPRPAIERARHPGLREPGDRRAGRARSRRCRSTASACCAPSSWSPTRSTGCTRARCSPRAGGDEFVDRMAAVAAAHHPGVRAPAGRLPHDRLPQQRVPRPRRRRRVRARRGEPDDRLPRLLPLRARARAVPPRAASCWPGCARRRRTCT